MPTYILGAIVAALLVLPTCAFSQEIDIGPGGVRVGPGHDHYYNSGRGEWRELRQACLHKGELGEGGMGNCQRYR
jgi:hypothetical protein